MRKVHPFREMIPAEDQALARTAKASSERVAVVTRARALLAVHAGSADTQAARGAGSQRGDSVSQLVEHFTEPGLAARHSAGGRGRQAASSLAHRDLIRAERQRVPDRTQDTPATGSLTTLEGALRQHAEVAQLCASTSRGGLRAAG
jgi:hypothetical protein